ncbi:MAG: hypothetical protein HYY95_02430 [Candidatus Rokubacteria bacterium]|nr:hypothetical protein [Candidatus Rokubacteria bacterium]
MPERVAVFMDGANIAYCYLLPGSGERERMVAAAVAAASCNSAWPEGYAWEQ